MRGVTEEDCVNEFLVPRCCCWTPADAVVSSDSASDGIVVVDNKEDPLKECSGDSEDEDEEDDNMDDDCGGSCGDDVRLGFSSNEVKLMCSSSAGR